jgi:hypothetical protein
MRTVSGLPLVIATAMLALLLCSKDYVLAEESKIGNNEVVQANKSENSVLNCGECCSEVADSGSRENNQVAETDTQCGDRCERSRERCYKDGGSTIKCESQYDKCVTGCM